MSGPVDFYLENRDAVHQEKDKMSEPCCTVGYTICDKNGHVPGGPFWMVHWLPKGYAITAEDRLLCGFFDTDGKWDEQYGPKNPPPLIAAVMKAITEHLKEHPEDIAGHLDSKDW